jgi:hypothetical protein
MTLEEQKVFIDFGWSPLLNSEARIVGWIRPADCSDELMERMCEVLGVRFRPIASVDKSELLLCEMPCPTASTK